MSTPLTTSPRSSDWGESYSPHSDDVSPRDHQAEASYRTVWLHDFCGLKVQGCVSLASAVDELTSALLGGCSSPPSKSDSVVVPLDSRAAAALLKKLFSRGDGKSACQLFDCFRRFQADHKLRSLCDVYTYTAMISCCVRGKEVERALDLYEEMPARGIARNVHTFSAMMNVCIKSGQLQLALRVYDEMIQAGCTPNKVTYHTLVDAYGKTGLWKQALRVKEEMISKGVEPDVRTFSTLMIACNCSGQWLEALALYKEMLVHGLCPSTVTYNALITAYSKAGKLDKVMEVYQVMSSSGCEKSVITYSSVISACEKLGRWRLALQVFAEMQAEGCPPNIVTYNSVMRACAQGKLWTMAGDVFEKMRMENCAPDLSTFTSLVTTYCNAGRWQFALQALADMRKAGHVPDANLYCTLVEELWSTGMILAQRIAVELCKEARLQVILGACNVFSRTKSLEIVVPSWSPGVATATVCCWLQEIMECIATKECQWSGETVIRIAKNKRTRDNHATPSVCLKEVLAKWLAAVESPFKPMAWSGNSCGFVAATEEVIAWMLEGPQIGHWLSAFGAFGPSNLTSCTWMASQVDNLLRRGEVAFSTVVNQEQSYCLDVGNMPKFYLKMRSGLIQQMLLLVKVLDIPTALVCDGIFLMDRLMASKNEDELEEGTLVVPMMVCVAIAARCQTDCDHHYNKVMEQLGCLSQLPIEFFEGVQANICKQVGANNAFTWSAYRYMGLYMGVLGLLDPSYTTWTEFDELMCKRAMQLMEIVMTIPSFLKFPPSLVACGVLSFYRSKHGILPHCPAILDNLTKEIPPRLEAMSAIQAELERLEAILSITKVCW